MKIRMTEPPSQRAWLDARIHDLEKRAMTGDRNAVLLIIDIRRKLHAAAIELLDKRYSDGECDGLTLSMFAGACDDAYEQLADRDPG